MADRLELACLRITPGWGLPPLPTYKLSLVQQSESYWIDTTKQIGRKRKQSRTSEYPEELRTKARIARPTF